MTDLRGHRAPAWLPGGHAQTIWPALFARPVEGAPLNFQRERWNTPDGDFVDIDFLRPDASHAATHAAVEAPLLVLFHGLEGSSSSHYAQAFGHWARGTGRAFAVPHFRGCSGPINLAPRAYHSGDWQEVGWLLDGLRQRSARPLHAVGVSLGGNALLRWAEEAGASAAAIAGAIAAVCAPLDLTAGGRAICSGANRLLYNRMFMRSLRPKALAKLAQHPGLFARERLLAARDLYAFDDVFTAPVHGFTGADDYWRRASAKPQLADIRIPTLALNALNDPVVPAHSLPREGEVGRHVTLWQPAHGGHVGFAAGRLPPGHVGSLPAAVMAWLQAHT